MIDSKEPITFTRAGALAGAQKVLPIAVSDAVYGLVFGVLAHQAGLSLLEAALMSGLVVAGSAQLVALSLWVAPLPVLAIVLTTLLVNLRYLVMGAALRPWFERLSAFKAYGSVFFMSDETWALTMGYFKAGGRNGAFLLGSSLVLTLTWLGGTVIGHLAGAAVQNPAAWGFDFAFVAVFVALLVGMWKGKGDLLPWAVAAVVAIAAARWLPGEWYILLGALAGSLTGALRHAD
ncbi:MAG TPA: AzlC family ABC transporter permease [Ktedonobacterales bacterium]|nr:AzlC family ABC transporter permease [Ktedonobacterales bacterium]